MIRRLQGQPEVLAHCQADDWDYAPRYTEGVCPLCGNAPEGMVVTLPWAAHVDWFWPAIGAMAVTSLLMGVLVLLAWLRGS